MIQILERLVQIIIDHYLIVLAFRLAVLDLVLGLGKSCLDGILGVCPSSSQSLLQCLHIRWLDETYSWIQFAFLQLFDTFHLYIENTYPLSVSWRAVDALSLSISYSLHSGPTTAIVISSKLSVLFELVVCYHCLEFFDSGEMIVHAIFFTVSRFPRGMRNREAKQFWMCGEELLQECALTSPRGAGEDDWAGTRDIYRCHVLVVNNTFWPDLSVLKSAQFKVQRLGRAPCASQPIHSDFSGCMQ